MNLALILTHNNLELTKRCVASVLAQDIRAVPSIFDNGSSDGTCQWAIDEHLDHTCMIENAGVSAGWNHVLTFLFAVGADHCLCIGNDTVLPAFFYRELLSYPQPFVTGFAVESMDDLREPTERRTEPHPDFSAFLIRRECWEAVGPFDETMKLYASDCDYHVRAHKIGIEMVKVPVPFYHERSSTLRLAPPAEQREIQEQANRDRQRFREKWGCIPGETAYEELFRG